MFDVFEPDGTYLGRVRPPQNATPKRFRGDDVWTVAEDEDGVKTLVKYRVVWQ